MTDQEDEDEEELIKRVMGRKFKDHIIETVYQNGKLMFCVYNLITGNWRIQERMITKIGVYEPPIMLADMAEHNYLFLPSEPEEYGDMKKLTKEIYDFLYKWCDYSEDFMKLDVYWAIATWIFDLFESVSYRKRNGATGTGKSRWATALTSICFRGFIQGASTTEAPIFRLLDAICGTQNIDENEFSKNSPSGLAILQILNSGNQKSTGLVHRCTGEGADIKVKGHLVYGPKVVASRERFEDDATENRSIVDISYETRRNLAPPLNLNKTFYRESRKIRNKLLLWRFRHYTKFAKNNVQTNPELLKLEVSARLKQITEPLFNVIDDKEVIKFLSTIIKDIDNRAINERKTSIEGIVLQAIFDIRKEDIEVALPGKRTINNLTIQNITDAVKEIDPSTSNWLTARYCGGLIRKRLGLNVDRRYNPKRGHGYAIVIEDKENIQRLSSLAIRFGFRKIAEEIGLISSVPSVTTVTSVTLLKGGSKTVTSSNIDRYTEKKSNTILLNNKCQDIRKRTTLPTTAKVTEVTKVTDVATQPMERAIRRLLYSFKPIWKSKEFDYGEVQSIVGVKFGERGKKVMPLVLQKMCHEGEIDCVSDESWKFVV